jgi:hypothetical protein
MFPSSSSRRSSELTRSAPRGKISLDKEDIDTEELRSVLRAVRAAREGEYVRVDGVDEDVRVSKQGDLLHVRVNEPAVGGAEENTVNIRLHMSVLEALAAGEGEDLDVLAAIHALGEHGEGELVVVHDEEATIESGSIHQEGAEMTRRSRAFGARLVALLLAPAAAPAAAAALRATGRVKEKEASMTSVSSSVRDPLRLPLFPILSGVPKTRPSSQRRARLAGSEKQPTSCSSIRRRRARRFVWRRETPRLDRLAG